MALVLSKMEMIQYVVKAANRDFVVVFPLRTYIDPAVEIFPDLDVTETVGPTIKIGSMSNAEIINTLRVTGILMASFDSEELADEWAATVMVNLENLGLQRAYYLIYVAADGSITKESFPNINESLNGESNERDE